MEIRGDFIFWLTLPFAIIFWLAVPQYAPLTVPALMILFAVIFPERAKKIGNWLISKVDLRFTSMPTTFQWILFVVTAVLVMLSIGACAAAQQPGADVVHHYAAATFLTFVAFVLFNFTAWLNRRNGNKKPPSRLRSKSRPPHLKVVP